MAKPVSVEPSDKPGLVQKKLRLLMELRRAGIADLRVLGAIERTPREQFVPPAFADQAYENVALPIDDGQTISQPYVVALMSEALQAGDRHNVIEIGTGSGSPTASSCSQPEIPASPRKRPMTSRSGCRDRGPIARFRAARIAGTFRRGGCRRAIVRPRARAPCRCTR